MFPLQAEFEPEVVLLFPLVIDEKSSLRICVAFPPPASAVIVMESVALPLPEELEAETVELVVPAEAGVPETRPVEVLMERPAGRLVAAKAVGEFEAVT